MYETKMEQTFWNATTTTLYNVSQIRKPQVKRKPWQKLWFHSTYCGPVSAQTHYFLYHINMIHSVRLSDKLSVREYFSHSVLWTNFCCFFFFLIILLMSFRNFNFLIASFSCFVFFIICILFSRQWQYFSFTSCSWANEWMDAMVYANERASQRMVSFWGNFFRQVGENVALTVSLDVR